MKRFVILDMFIFDQELYSISTMKGKVVRLSKMEVEVLSLLCAQAGRTVTRTFLFENAWPNGTGNDGHLNRVILILRRKFESLGANEVIKTIPKVGYSIQKATIAHDSEYFVNAGNQDLEIVVVEDIMQTNELFCAVDDDGTKRSPLESEIFIPKKSDVISKKKYLTIAALATVIVGGICVNLLRNINPHESLHLGKFNIINKHGNNFTIYYDNRIFDSNNETLATINAVNDNISKHTGKYYISLSNSAISIVHIEETNNSVIKRIFLRSESANIIDELDCALNDVNHLVASTSTLSSRSVSLDTQDSVLNKSLSYIVSNGCPYKNSDNVKWEMELAFRANSPANPYFISTSKITTTDGEPLFKIVTDGSYDVVNKDNKHHNLWLSKTISLEQFTTLDNRNSISNASAFKLLEAYSKINYSTNTIKINNSVYLSDFLDGVILSFL